MEHGDSDFGVGDSEKYREIIGIIRFCSVSRVDSDTHVESRGSFSIPRRGSFRSKLGVSFSRKSRFPCNLVEQGQRCIWRQSWGVYRAFDGGGLAGEVVYLRGRGRCFAALAVSTQGLDFCWELGTMDLQVARQWQIRKEKWGIWDFNNYTIISRNIEPTTLIGSWWECKLI